MKQKGFAPIIILVLITLAIAGYFGYKNYWPKLQSFVTPTPSATPIVTTKVNCKDPRPEVCTMECVETPPYICGSDGKSYCSVCQACSNLTVAWYEMKNSLCEEEKFCGGFAANLPENQCPNGFYCKLDGNYPDAGGVCTKN